VKKLILVVVVISLLVCSCSWISPAPPVRKARSSSERALVEYSLDGEEWIDLFRDKDKRVAGCSVFIRQTEAGTLCDLLVKADARLPYFSGDIIEKDEWISVEGEGALVIAIKCPPYEGGDANWVRFTLLGCE